MLIWNPRQRSASTEPIFYVTPNHCIMDGIWEAFDENIQEWASNHATLTCIEWQTSRLFLGPDFKLLSQLLLCFHMLKLAFLVFKPSLSERYSTLVQDDNAKSNTRRQMLWCTSSVLCYQRKVPGMNKTSNATKRRHFCYQVDFVKQPSKQVTPRSASPLSTGGGPTRWSRF